MDPKASPAYIRESFLKQAHKYHPDKHKGNKLAEKRFQQINEAYQLLNDPEKRKAFDKEWLLRKQLSNQKSVSVSSSKKSDFKKEGPVSDVRLFSRRKQESMDLAISLPVSLEDFCLSKPLSISYLRPFKGKREKKEISLSLPKGMSPGAKLKFKGKGGGSSNKTIGDLYVQIVLKPHSLFKVKGWDVFLELPITMFDALLLKEITVPTVYGQALLKVPQEIRPKELLRLKGLGLPKTKQGEKGDMFVRFFIEFPKSMEKELSKDFPNLKQLPKEKIRNLAKSYEARRPFLFPKTSVYRSRFLDLLKERQKP